jgi:uncharacterized RDD family membrane protein YckC
MMLAVTPLKENPVLPSQTVRFETPENIAVTYRLAGPGTRFVAHTLDTLIVTFAVIFLSIGALIAVIATGVASEQFDTLDFDESQVESAMGVALGVIYVVGAFASMVYHTIMEWWWNGQTVGKRAMNIRVVTEGGFALSLTPVLIRSLFRMIDEFPIFWMVPVVAKNTRRFGDMVAGTLVIQEEEHTTQTVREQLAARDVMAAEFRFSEQQLDALRDVDVQALEVFLERRGALHEEHRRTSAQRLARGLTQRVDQPPIDTQEAQERFLEDLFAAYARREVRELV